MSQTDKDLPTLRPMREDDIDRVLEIIYDHDEDDAATAEQTYRDAGMADKFVLTQGKTILGTTGFNAVEDTDRTYWLSWTYLDDTYRGKGYGRLMMEGLFERLRARSARKIFLTTSDYQDPEEGDIYESARTFYTSLGFEEELRHKDFYAPGETMIYYGFRFPDNDSVKDTAAVDDEGRPVNAGAVLTGITEIPETRDAYGLEWRYTQDGTYFDERTVNKALAKAREWKARAVFASFPSDLSGIEGLMKPKGFTQHGRLRDFFEDGIDDCHWRYDFKLPKEGEDSRGNNQRGRNDQRGRDQRGRNDNRNRNDNRRRNDNRNDNRRRSDNRNDNRRH